MSAVVGAEPPSWGQYHPWWRFQPGSWSLVETRTETFGGDGKSTDTSITRTRTTLQEVTPRTYTLLIESSVELGGRGLESPPQTLTKGLWGDKASVVTVKEASPADPFELPDRLVPVRRFEVEVLGETTVCKQVIDFSDEQSPHVLRRTIECFARPDHALLYSTRVSTLNVELPFRFRDRVIPVAYVQTLQKLKQSETLTLETFSHEIPGGVTGHSSKELGAHGELLRRSTMELIDFHVAAEPGQGTREVGAEAPAAGPTGVRPEPGSSEPGKGAEGRVSGGVSGWWPVPDPARQIGATARHPNPRWSTVRSQRPTRRERVRYRTRSR